MELEAGGLARVGVEFGGEVAAVFQEFNPGQRRTEPHVEGFPMPRFVQPGAHPPRAVAEKPDDWQAREHVENNFTWSKVVERCLDAYEDSFFGRLEI